MHILIYFYLRTKKNFVSWCLSGKEICAILWTGAVQRFFLPYHHLFLCCLVQHFLPAGPFAGNWGAEE